ncbi:hypothetical protein BO71DRAFT_90675 [Aspergillus ellipticus CBS 707.79]|uniref:Uncharacterized protein n=1 Tax=Aspergillus ellipticus CBS 707.79 TaxID=1448320 RepID=A0A319EGP3_9EURO|nr:hypothetical protein BO71DRAFT_90675 [Aspergillus ellipticus CBS 707.79]
MQEHYYLYFFFSPFFYLLTNCVGGKQNKIITTRKTTKDDPPKKSRCLCVTMARDDYTAFASFLFLSHISFSFPSSIYLFVTLYMGRFASFNVFFFISVSDPIRPHRAVFPSFFSVLAVSHLLDGVGNGLQTLSAYHSRCGCCRGRGPLSPICFPSLVPLPPTCLHV